MNPLQVEYTGYAAHYNTGLMERVSRNRDMDIVDCMIASPFHKIGHWVYVESKKNNKVKLCRVTDVPQPADRASIIRRGIIAELDFTSAKELCNIKRVNEAPPRQCPITIYERFKQNGYFRFATNQSRTARTLSIGKQTAYFFRD